MNTSQQKRPTTTAIISEKIYNFFGIQFWGMKMKCKKNMFTTSTQRACSNGRRRTLWMGTEKAENTYMCTMRLNKYPNQYTYIGQEKAVKWEGTRTQFHFTKFWDAVLITRNRILYEIEEENRIEEFFMLLDLYEIRAFYVCALEMRVGSRVVYWVPGN